MSDREHLSIGEVLAQLQEEFPDVSISKIRFLESQGLIEPQRTPSGYRQFFDEDTARLRWILMEQRDNFLPLKIIKERLSAGEFDRWYADGAVVPGSIDDSQPTLFEPAPPPPATAKSAADSFTDDEAESEIVDVGEIAAELEVTDDLDDAMADAEVHSLADAARKRAADLDPGIDTAPQFIDPEAELIDTAPEFIDPEAELIDTAPEFIDPEAELIDEVGEPAPVLAPEAPRPPATVGTPEPPEPVATGPAAVPDPEPVVDTAEPTDPVVHDVMLAAARQAASRAQPPRRPDPLPPPEPAPSPPPPPPATGDGPLDAGPTSVSMTVEELSRSTGLTPAQLGELERYGLLHSRAVGPAVYYDGDAMVVAKLAAAFLRHGVEARHLRMYKTAAEREAGVFEQVVAPMVRRSDATSRREARERLVEMARLGEALHAALLRLTLRAYTDPH